MSYYDHREFLANQEIEIKRRLEERQEKWLKEQKNIILGEIKQLKGNPGDLNKIYTKKEIAASKKADLKEVEKEIMDEQKEQLKEAKIELDNDVKNYKRELDNAVKHYKKQITQSKNDYNKTKKRLSKIDTSTLNLIKEELNEKWEKQWGKSQKSTRKNK
jgi:polyribonucleotide nucleotidyltransferase